jgi:diaminopropionate ammonia-lyase
MQAFSPARLIINPRFADDNFGPREAAVMSVGDFATARETIVAWPEYAATPLIDRRDLAETLGLGALAIKYEGARFAVQSFKALGPAYAAHRAADHARAAGLHAITLCAATSGNHGRAVAWAARKLGAACRIYMNEGVSPGRAQAIAAFGATIIRVPGTYDDALDRCHDEAAKIPGAYVISDAVLPAYPEAPRHTMHGYGMLGEELADQSADATHVFVGAGSGMLVAAVTARLWQRFGARRPKVVVVEPLAADALYQSAAAGRAASTAGSLSTVMDGLSVLSASTLAWDLLERGAYGFLAIPDPPAVEAMKAAYRTEPSLIIGETGIAGLAGVLVAARDPEIRRSLGLDARAKVVAVACEGATDLDVFHRLTGDSM